MYHRSIRNLTTGHPIATAGFDGPNPAGDAWEWMQETVAAELECRPEQVGAIETDDGDVLTVDGVPVYKIGR